MPVYRYQAVDENGRNLSGMMAAEDEPKLEKKLKTAGLWLLDAQIDVRVGGDAGAAKDSKWVPLWGKKKRRALIDFCTMMAFQTKVGIPLVQALAVIGEQYENPHFRRTVAGAQRLIEGGLRFHEALARYPGVFSKEFVGIIKAGEASSKLPETFRDLKHYQEWVDKVIQEVRQATLYPMIVLSVISVFVLALFTFIVPKFATLLTRLHVPLPMITQVIFGVSEFATRTWWLWALLILFLTVGLKVGSRLSPRFACGVDRVKLKLPVFGELNSMLAISRFAHNFVMLYRAGISVIPALELCQGLVGNLVVGEAIAGMKEDVKDGATISEAMRRHGIFPPMLLRMVMMGEATGNLDAAMEDVAGYFNQVIPERIKKMLGILEPMLMLSLIGVVLVVALAIYLPLVTLMGSIK